MSRGVVARGLYSTTSGVAFEVFKQVPHPQDEQTGPPKQHIAVNAESPKAQGRLPTEAC